jgi:hypothetical protein
VIHKCLLLRQFFGLVSKVAIATVTRFISPKEVVVNIGMDPTLFVQANLKNLNLKYQFSKRDLLIGRQHEGWRIAEGRKWLVLTEHYVDKRKELILICKDLP